MATTGSSAGQLGITTRWVLLALLVIVGGLAAWLVRDIILLTFASVILAVMINTPVRFFTRRGLRRGLAVVVSLIIITVIVVLAFILVVPDLLRQFASLAGFIPRAIEELQSQFNSGELAAQFPWLQQVLDQVNIDFTALGPIIEQIGAALGQIPTVVFPFVGGVASALLSVLVVIFMTLYFIATPHVYMEGFIRLIPINRRARAAEVVDRLSATLQGFLQAKLTSMFLLGLGTFIGLGLLGIPLAAALGTITGVLSFVPNFGPLVALIPALAVTIVNAPENVLWVIVVMYGLQFVESQVVGPLLVSEQISLPPVLVLVGQIIAGVFFGFMGLLLAVPLTAIAMVLIQEIYIKDILGDYDDMPIAPPLVDEEMLPDGI